MAKKYYEILEISETATQDEIKKAYRKLALKYHPDKNPNNQEEAKKNFQEVNKAYGILSNEELRKRYDDGETNFTTDFGSEHEKSFWETKEEKLAEEVKIMEELLNAHKDTTEIMEKIWLLNAEYLERSDTASYISSAFSATYPLVFKEDLDSKYNKLWRSYQDWNEKVWTMPINLKRKEKEYSEELRILKEEMIKAIKEAEAKKQAEEKEKQSKKKERASSKVGREKNNAVEEIERLMTEKGLKSQDLGEYSNYQEQIDNLNKIWEVRELRDKVMVFVNNWKSKTKGGDEKRGKDGNFPTGGQDKSQDQETEGQIPSKSDDNNKNSKVDYNKLSREELIKEVNSKDLENSSLKEIIQALERKVEELEEEIKELKTEPQTSEIKSKIRKRENYLQEAKNSLEKINALNTENLTGNTGNNNKSGNEFPTSWVIGGGILAVVGLVAVLVVRKNKKKKSY